MKKSLALSLAFLAFFDVHAQQNQPWFKGNLHTHSLWSDGDDYPEMIMDWYKSHGYNFVALTDHNILAEGEKWVTITSKNKLLQDGLKKYLDKYGSTWVVSRSDSAKTEVKLKTLSEYRPLFEDKNFLIIKAEEITDRYERKPIHLNATNIQTLIEPQHGNSVADVMQRNIDAVLKQRSESGVPMLVHINHPNFGWAITLNDMIALRGERFFEVYNGHPLVHNYGDSSHMSTEDMWDKINIAYVRENKPLMYGLATDDSHNYHESGLKFSNAGRGWVMVQADSLTPGALIRSLEAGNFYSTTGVALDQVKTTNKTLFVKVRPEPGVSYRIEFIGVKKGEERSKILKTVQGSEGSFKVSSHYTFVRSRIISSKIKSNPFSAGDLEMAWTQPISPQ
jgi:hypothetical protein